MTISAGAGKLKAGGDFPEFDLPRLGGGRVHLGGTGGWQMIVVYRGKHCPICKRYLKTLEGLREGFAEAGAQVIVISADPLEKATPYIAETGLGAVVGYDLSIEQMRRLGLYISNPRTPQETDRPYSEPALFIVNPDGKTQFIDISNAPFSRPDLAGILSGLKYVQTNDYPIRGTAE